MPEALTGVVDSDLVQDRREHAAPRIIRNCLIINASYQFQPISSPPLSSEGFSKGLFDQKFSVLPVSGEVAITWADTQSYIFDVGDIYASLSIFYNEKGPSAGAGLEHTKLISL